MAKESLTVWLRAIAYSGTKIGNDTKFKVSVGGGGAIEIPTSVLPGTTRLFNKAIFMEAAETRRGKVAIAATAVEEDLVSDMGTKTFEYQIRPVEGRQVLPVVPVAVQENLGVFGKRGIASFEFSFELERWSGEDPGIRYVVSDDNGWLLVRAEDKIDRGFSLPHLVKVEVTRCGRLREYFTVLEGPLRGRKGSVALRNGVSSFSPTAITRDPPVQLVYHRKSRRLGVPGLGVYDVALPPRNPFPVRATFHVEIPDFPHAPGQRYEKRATFAASWFRIADPQVPDRYLHVGNRSAGCSTVKDDRRWDELYRFLINRRLDDRNVATLTVTAD